MEDPSAPGLPQAIATESPMPVKFAAVWTTRALVAVGALVAIGWTLGLALPPADARADTILMKSGLVYRSLGPPDRDNTLVFINDAIKRVVVRDSKIEKIEPDNSFRTGEKFQLVQPLSKHGGVMPKDVLSVAAGPWDERGRRTFRYLGAHSKKPESMEQAIINIGPHVSNIRGVDGFWVGVVDTESIPRPVIVGLLERVERKNATERERAVRFLMDMGWHAEAKKALDELVHDFPQADLKERAAGARAFLNQAEGADRLVEVDARREAKQPRKALALLKSIDEKAVGTAMALDVRERLRRIEQEAAGDRALALDLEKLGRGLSNSERAFWKGPLIEVLKALELAPEAVRDRMAAWQKARLDPKTSTEAQFALAMSGYVVGYDKAVAELKPARVLWEARDLVLVDLAGGDARAPGGRVDQLQDLEWPVAAGEAETQGKLELLTRIVELMPPPRHDDAVVPEKTILHRAPDQDAGEPTEYALRLPPEYHPLRSYPAVVLLHSGRGPESVVEQWAKEADKRGFILIAPRFEEPGRPFEYRYTSGEHAAVVLALRDALKRYAVDSNRVYLAGMLEGGNMAWDCGLAHPDLFAGVVVISGFPAKYVPRYLSHHDRLPIAVTLGDLAPAADSFIFSTYVKPLIVKAWDVTYTEYNRRGLEEIPEEIPRALDWMKRRRRDPYPRSFDVVSARTGDDRFYGLVVKEFDPGRTTAPEAVEVLGQNLKPATIKMKSSAQSNLVNLQTSGVRRLDVWLSPKLFDFKRRLEVRINGKPYFRQSRIKLELEPMLDDLRIRGDRGQIYWYKVAAG